MSVAWNRDDDAAADVVEDDCGIDVARCHYYMGWVEAAAFHKEGSAEVPSLGSGSAGDGVVADDDLLADDDDQKAEKVVSAMVSCQQQSEMLVMSNYWAVHQPVCPNMPDGSC